MRFAPLLIGVVLPALALPAQNLAPNLKRGASSRIVVAVRRLDFNGTSTKPSGNQATKTPMLIQVTSVTGSNANLEITSGPLISLGRSVGRAKINKVSVDGGLFTGKGAPYWMAVTMPVTGVRPKQTWTAPLYGPSPLPAGLRASYRYVGNVTSAGTEFARVDMSIQVQGLTKVVGSGQLYLRLSDGLLDHGAAKFEMIYLRPSKPGEPLSVSSRTTLDCQITPS